MRPLNVLPAAVLVAMCALASPAAAAGATVVNQTKVVGNSVVIKSSGGSTTVAATSSCGSGISGFFYQSVRVLFGGSVIYSDTQSATCP